MMPAFRYITTLCVGAFFCLQAAAQTAPEAFASLEVSFTKLLVGDQADVCIVVQCDPTKTRIVWPQIPDSFGRLEVVQKLKIDSVKKGALTVYSQCMKVSGWDSGEYSIPSFQVGIIKSGAAPYNLTTEGKILSVSTVPVDTTKPFKPIKGIMQVEGSWLDYLGWIILGLHLLAAIIGLIIWLKTRRKPMVVTAPPTPEPLHEKALRLLTALENENVWQRGEVKEYYVRLTDILRNYVEERFNVPALERTTDELTAAANSHIELAFHAQKLHSILATADMAKFARAQPTPAEHISTMQAAKEIVMATIPKPVVSAEGNTPTPPAQP